MRLGLITLAIAFLLALAAGCGSDGDSDQAESATLAEVLAAVDGLDAEAREAKLVELAQAEDGPIQWMFTALTEEKGQRIMQAFEDAYGIEITGYDSTTGEVVQRITEEASAGVSTIDAAFLSEIGAFSLGESGLLGPYAPGPGSLTPAEGVREGWVAARSAFIVLGWNTDLLEPEEVPRALEDLADPRWKGQFVMNPDRVEWYLGLSTYWLENGKSQEEIDELFRQIASNTVFVQGGSIAAQMLAAGDFELSATATSLFEPLAREGAPVAWEPVVEPAFVGFNGPAVILSAPHPAGAVLLTDWLVSEEGQTVLEQTDVTPVRALETTDYDYVVEDVEELATNETWNAEWDELVSLGASIEAPE